MRITLKRKSLLLVAIVILFITSILLALYFLMRSREYIGIYDYYNSCENYGCYVTSDGKMKQADITLLNLDKKNNSKSIITFESWDSDTNHVTRIALKLKVSALQGIVSINSKNYRMSISAEERSLPFPYWSNKEKKISFSRIKIEDISFLNLQEEYLNSENNFDYKGIKESVLASLLKDDDLEEEDIFSSILFLFNDTLSKGMQASGDYEYAEILDARDVVSGEDVDVLESNCRVLKKYYPNNKCMNPEGYNINSNIEIILSTKLADQWDLSSVLDGMVISDSSYVKNIRNDDKLWQEYYLLKRSVLNNDLSKYIYSILDYLYYSGLSCNDLEDPSVCEILPKLYRYSQQLAVSSEGNLCSRISYLPLLVSVTGDAVYEEDLNYILENYPFIQECTTDGGQAGFCSIDFRERVACAQLLLNSLEYYKKDDETKGILKLLIDDTLAVYLGERKERVGLWGREDINLLMGQPPEEKLFPIEYFDYRDNYLFYNILGGYLNE